MVPEANELVVTVRVLVPAAAVIVTESAFDDCQLRVTLWPDVMDFESADRDTVGAKGAALDVPEHEDKPHVARSTSPDKIQRTALQFMLYKHPTSRYGAANQMPVNRMLVVETL
ncbi:MAG TPA: hypothetical protein VMP68_20235 [Candidatus Eisenbacteria bacterium]|nr:hypothetical protein [Candidatus Eisenbacteria bacterium]